MEELQDVENFALLLLSVHDFTFKYISESKGTGKIKRKSRNILTRDSV